MKIEITPEELMSLTETLLSLLDERKRTSPLWFESPAPSREEAVREGHRPHRDHTRADMSRERELDREIRIARYESLLRKEQKPLRIADLIACHHRRAERSEAPERPAEMQEGDQSRAAGEAPDRDLPTREHRPDSPPEGAS